MLTKIPERILGIETSCDDTCAAVVAKGRKVLSNIVSSQEVHGEFGGVVPELAARKHVEKISTIVQLALTQAQCDWQDIEGIAVTNRYGLASSLLVGVAMAKALAYSRNIPLVGIHHVEGHLYSNFLSHANIELPHISLTVSGGHTTIVLVDRSFSYRVLGQTIDDAVGEAYDKVARHLGLGFPGGPIIDHLAQKNIMDPISFPSPMLSSGDYRFSLSGLKTAVRYYIDKLTKVELAKQMTAIAAGFQQAVVKVLVHKTCQAAIEHKVTTITLSGGVAANSCLRRELQSKASDKKIRVYYPQLCFCTDNAAMIAGLGYHKFCQHQHSDFTLDARPDALLPGVAP